MGSVATTAHVPLILVRGFGGLSVEDERQIAYQGFNDGTVYPHKQGENYIYEGLILKYLKSGWKYHDATNVVGYRSAPLKEGRSLPAALTGLDPSYFVGLVTIDPGTALKLVTSPDDPRRSLWVFRYYDLDKRSFTTYSQALIRLIDFVRDLTALKTSGSEKPPVNILAHSMGGLIVREAIQCGYRDRKRAEDCINKIVTLGTPHQGISFQGMRDWKLFDVQDELERFSPDKQSDATVEWSFLNFEQYFSPRRVLTVVGTNYRTYTTRAASVLNRLFSAPHEYGQTYNRSDGLVKQRYAQLPGAPRTFVHKCHGGYDSLVTARESFEIATRFFHGNLRARLNLVGANVKRGFDWFGKSEFFLGISVKPRRVDFDLFHQSAEAENCYGPFRKPDFSDPLDDENGFAWAGPNRMIWEGWLDTSRIALADADQVPDESQRDLVIRLDVYVGERDLLGVGFSDNVVFRKQYYIRACAPAGETLGTAFDRLQVWLHWSEDFDSEADRTRLSFVNGSWQFHVIGTGFEGDLSISLDRVPPEAT
jgi:PGAP1-like protein